MIRRTGLGSMERFLACLIEHYAGAFPLWLAPVQAGIIPIADRHIDYAREIESVLKAVGLRVQVDSRSERMNMKIRDAQVQKVPYMLVVGDAEASSLSVSIRLRNGENLGSQSLEYFKTIAEAALRSGE